MVDQKSKNRLSVALSANSIRGALNELIRAYGHDPALISVENLQVIADRLSQAGGKEPGWGWRYLRNVLNGKLDASEKLTQAIMRLGAIIDGAPMEPVQGTPVQVLAVGKVKAGAVVMGDSRPCARLGCAVEFVPRVPWQKYHSKDCQRNARTDLADKRGKK